MKPIRITIHQRVFLFIVATLSIFAAMESAQAARAVPGGWTPYTVDLALGTSSRLQCNKDADHQQYIVSGYAGLPTDKDIRPHLLSCSLFWTSKDSTLEPVTLEGSATVHNTNPGQTFTCPENQVLVGIDFLFKKDDDKVAASYSCQVISAKLEHTKVMSGGQKGETSVDTSQPSGEMGNSYLYCGVGSVAVGGRFDTWKNTAQLVCASLAAEGQTIETGAILRHFGNESYAGLGECAASLSDSAIVARSHVDDENGPTTYLCARYYQNESRMVLTGSASHHSIEDESEAGTFNCPSAAVMVGRSHEDDENGSTDYWCQSLGNKWGETAKLQNIKESPSKVEHRAMFDCSPGVMTGRYHLLDENGSSSVYCGELY